MSIYDPEDRIEWNIRSDLADVLKDLAKEYKPKWIQTHEEVFDFMNKYRGESILAQIKKTKSRERMIENGLDINPKYRGKISTVTTKQDRWPNVGNLKFTNKRSDKNGIPFTNRRFITHREAYKLMGFDEELFEKANTEMMNWCVSEINARDKLLKQAGNSIAVNSLEMIFYYMNKLNKEIK